ncbi:MAG: phenylalanine--tRNA ligase subunit beta, partial [Desulfuromonadales bacterium]|nr:phenylalanine--tRNA ligase subunit beta [Desulfuromonadales bacterium]
KGVAEALLQQLRLATIDWSVDGGEPFLHPGKSCAIRSGDSLLGTLGEIHPEVLAAFEIDLPVIVLDLDLPALLACVGAAPGFRSLSRYPDTSRDNAFLVDEEVSAKQLFAVLERVRGRDVEQIVLFDLYRGKGIPAGKKSLAIRVRYRSAEKTLTDEEINRDHSRLIEALQKSLGAELR